MNQFARPPTSYASIWGGTGGSSSGSSGALNTMTITLDDDTPVDLFDIAGGVFHVKIVPVEILYAPMSTFVVSYSGPSVPYTIGLHHSQPSGAPGETDLTRTNLVPMVTGTMLQVKKSTAMYPGFYKVTYW